MTTRTERKPIRFSKWTPARRDSGISYTYLNPNDGRMVHSFGDRWMRAKWRIAVSALATGVEEFTVYGGLANRRWTRTVLCNEEEADEYLRAGGTLLKGEYRRALATRERRLQRQEERP